MTNLKIVIENLANGTRHDFENVALGELMYLFYFIEDERYNHQVVILPKEHRKVDFSPF